MSRWRWWRHGGAAVQFVGGGISLDPKNPLFSLLDCGSSGDDGGRRHPSMTTAASLFLVPHLLIKPSFRCLSRKVSTGFSPVFFSCCFPAMDEQCPAINF
jgi:hypothetical protein